MLNFCWVCRKEDIRETNKDTVEVQKCFRPGDIILARVLSIGDSQSFLLTTAEDNLGVISANCEKGKQSDGLQKTVHILILFRGRGSISAAFTYYRRYSC